MKEGGLVLKAKDEQRIGVLIRVEGGLVSVREAAGLLSVSERQVRRLLAAYREQGPRGVVHGNRGRPPAHAISEAVRERVRVLATSRYAGVNHSHLAELLAEREGLTIPRSTLSDILRGAEIRSPRPQRRRPRHRSRRERYPQEGMLLQIDASHHDWLQGRGPRPVLLAVIDDATGKVPAARFHDTEDARGYFLLMRDLCRKTGVPIAIYSDKHSIFWPTQGETLKEQLAGRRSPTQFGRALSELGIQLIAAHSPQAKGRIERLWGTFQDRLVSELRIAGATSIEQANAYLPGFLARFNRTFAVQPAVPGSAYGPRRKAAHLDQILCFKHERVVSKDNLVKIDEAVNAAVDDAVARFEKLLAGSDEAAQERAKDGLFAVRDFADEDAKKKCDDLVLSWLTADVSGRVTKGAFTASTVVPAIGPPAVDALVKVLEPGAKDSDDLDKLAVPDLILKTATPAQRAEAAKHFVAFAKSLHPNLPGPVAVALLNLAGPDVVEFLMAYGADRGASPEGRFQAMTAMVTLATPELRPTVEKIALDPEAPPGVRGKCFDILIKFKDPASLKVLYPLSTDEKVQGVMGEVVVGIGGKDHVAESECFLIN